MLAHIEIQQRDGICFLHCRGRLVPGPDIEYVRTKMSELENLNSARVLADFREVRSIGSTGVSFIVSIYNSVARHSGGHFVIADVAPPVREVLDLTRLSTVIAIAEDLASARAKLDSDCPPAVHTSRPDPANCT
jgi:anti-anti-sigma factor